MEHMGVSQKSQRQDMEYGWVSKAKGRWLRIKTSGGAWGSLNLWESNSSNTPCDRLTIYLMGDDGFIIHYPIHAICNGQSRNIYVLSQR